jgi:acetyl-CoA carboxylase alpha subunit
MSGAVHRLHAAGRRPLFGEDNAIIGGFARFRGEPVAVIGQEKGSDTKSRLKHNFGMAGRKAIARRCASWNWPSASRFPW